MRPDRKTRFTVLAGGYNQLEALHDRVLNLLDSPEKKGIRRLLKKNNDSCQKLLFPCLGPDQDQATVMTALAGLLEAHARECYTIGYLDCLINRSLTRENSLTSETEGKTSP